MHSFRKSCRLCGNVEKYGTAGQATCDDIMLCMPDKYGKNTEALPYYLIFHIALIPFDIVNCVTATLTKNEKLSNVYSVNWN